MKLRTPHDDAEPPMDLDEIYRVHARFVWRVAAAFGVPASQREDVMHDVFVVLHHKIAELDPARPVTTWLFGITRMVVRNRRRREGRHERKLRVVPPPPSGPDPEAQVEMRSRAQLVCAFLDSLDARRRVVFELTEIEGMTGPEVAEATGVNLDTVYTRLRSARQAFRAFVAAHRPEAAPP
jgi:RNA polymerase sigma-70 factor, ECF subfamily